MPEYLAPGVFVEEVSFRAKSVTPVGTTTTGFVGPARYGPIDIEPDVITGIEEFERAYGDSQLLDFGGGIGLMHNYVWHGARSFFEEGGRRLYVSRVFLPLVGTGGALPKYETPPEALADDLARPDGGLYKQDGHARAWLTKSTAAVNAADAAIKELGTLVAATAAAADDARASATDAADTAADPNAAASDVTQADATATARAKAMKDKLDKVASAEALAEPLAASAAAAYPAQTVSLAAEKAARIDAANAVDSATAATVDVGVLDSAAVDSVTKAGAAYTQVGVVEQKAAALSATAGISAALKTMSDALEAACTAGGDSEKAFKAAKDAADGVKTKADAANAAPGDAGKRTDAGNAAKAAIATAQAAMDQAVAATQAQSRMAAQADFDNAAAPIRTAVNALGSEAKNLADAATAALAAARATAYPRAFAVAQAADKVKKVAIEYGKVADASAAAVAGAIADAPTADHSGAVLLRARFPGAAGNFQVRFTLRIAPNGLIGTPGSAAVQGVQPGDFVWIGTAAGGKMLLAYPTADGSDWYFTPDGKPDNAQYWLNQPRPPSAGATRLTPGTHEVHATSMTVEVRPGKDGAESWNGLAVQPNHKRAGAADSVSEKFRAKPASANDARLLPFVMLLDDSIAWGTQLFDTLFNVTSSSFPLPAKPAVTVTYTLSGGNDGLRPGAGEYADMGGADLDGPKMGLKAFEDIDDIAIVAAPGSTFGFENGYHDDADQVVRSLIAHAENMRYRIAVLDSGNGQSVSEVRAMKATYDSKYAALYYPWVKVLDPVTRSEIVLPPSGFVTGIYARNDIERAVYKAPANEVVRGAIGFETLLNKAQQEVLNPEGINCFRYFEGRGFRLWGARTTSSDPEWMYVNLRRYFAYLEHSIDRSTQWAVFEPNGDLLWANVRRTIEDFLFNEWQNGALLGDKPEKSYFVKCDRSTMSQNDLDNGRLVCLIGVCPLRPAEFVIFRIGQWTADRKV